MAQNATIIPFRQPPPRDDAACRQAKLIMGLTQLSDEADALGQTAIAQILLGAAICLADRLPPGHPGGGRRRA